MIEQQRVYRIKDLDSLLGFLREDLCWELPEASIDDVSFEWTGLDLNLSEDINKKLKGGLIRQLQPFATYQPWGIFVVEFATREVSIITLRQILRCFVAKRRGARPDLPAWQCENLLFICLYGENGFTFAHFEGDKPYSSKLTTFSWHPGEPIRTVCEFNLPALVYDYTWTPETWVEEWQKAFDVEKVNKDFYRQIARFYYRLTGKEGQKRELVLPYVGDDSGSISIYEEFAVRLIGRSIFCWFLKHKESENDVPLIPPEALSLSAARETADFYHSMLEPLFFEVMNKRVKERTPLSIPRSEVIPFLNGGLFEQHPSDFYPGVANYGLKILDAWFIDFFSLLERYNFTITENSIIDVDVAVDPEMLGRIFENLLAEVVPETGETARKATGSYYTPRAIVDYMVEQSLKQYLLIKTELGEEKVNRLVDYGEDIEDFSLEEKLAAVTALREIKVVDPACGSGAFLMGVLHRMLAVLGKVDSRLELWRAQYLKSLDGIVRQTVEKNISRENWAYIRKLMIIRDSIYGVDIQPIAVEIAKLRCFLSLVVDELVLDEEENRGIEPLPNLEFKFVAANTLIGLPPRVEAQGAFGASEAIKKLKELRESYLRSFGAEKAQIEKEFRATQRKLFEENVQWALSDTMVRQLTEWDPFSYESCSWFDPGWMFGVEDGFDVVIANPPYINAINFKKILGEKIRKEYNRRFETARGTYDIFVLFFEKGLALLRENGNLCLITPNKYLSATYACALRNHILSNSTFIHICDLSTIGVFDLVSVYPVVTLLKKGISSHDYNIAVLQPVSRDPGSFDLNNFHLITVPSKSLTILPELIWGFMLSCDAKTLASVVKGTEPLSNLGEINATSTASESESFGDYISDRPRGQTFKLLNTGTIDRYISRWGKKPLKHGGNSYLTPYLCLENANVSQYRLDMYRQPKIIFAKMATRCEAYLDANGEYASVNTNCFFKPKPDISLKYILGYCNSKLFMFLYHQFFGSLRMSGGFFQFQAPQLRVIPIRHPEGGIQLSEFEKVVDAILSKKEAEPEEDTSEFECQIDQMVYELNGLTEEEIALVEKSSDK